MCICRGHAGGKCISPNWCLRVFHLYTPEIKFQKASKSHVLNSEQQQFPGDDTAPRGNPAGLLSFFPPLFVACTNTQSLSHTFPEAFRHGQQPSL